MENKKTQTQTKTKTSQPNVFEDTLTYIPLLTEEEWTFKQTEPGESPERKDGSPRRRGHVSQRPSSLGFSSQKTHVSKGPRVVTT